MFSTRGIAGLVSRIIATLAVGMSGVAAATVAPGPAYRYPPIAIVHVNVWPMTVDNAMLRDVTVLVRDGRIDKIVPAGKSVVPPGMKRIDGRGKWLMPALTDMHVHEENARALRLLTGLDNITPATLDNSDLLLPFVANGVLQVLNAGAMSEQLGLRDEVDAGRILGPHIELSALVDGSPPLWPAGIAHVAATPEDGRQTVREAKDNGFDFVKTYSKLDLDTFTAIVDEAHKQGIRVIGHIPGRALDETEKWLQPGYEMVMHAEEYAYQTKDPAHWIDEIPHYVELAKRTGVLLCSTLTVDARILEQMRDPSTLQTRPEMKFVNPATHFMWTNNSRYAHASAERIARVAQVVEFNKRLVKAFADAGMAVYPGTDTMVPGLVAGFALHDELELLAGAGLTPQQILTADTRLAADFLHTSVDRGTVEAGKRADLLLLNADPMSDVANTRKIAAVIATGRYLPASELDKKMADLARRYAATPPIKGDGTAGGHSGGGGHFPDDDE